MFFAHYAPNLGKKYPAIARVARFLSGKKYARKAYFYVEKFK